VFYGILSWILTFSHTTTGAEGPTTTIPLPGGASMTYDGGDVVDAIHLRAYAQVEAATNINQWNYTQSLTDLPNDRVSACDWANRQELAVYSPVVELFVVDTPANVDRTVVYYSGGARSEAAADVFLESLGTLGWPVLKQYDASLPTNCPIFLKIGIGNVRGPDGGGYLGNANWRDVFADRVALAAMAVAKVPEE